MFCVALKASVGCTCVSPLLMWCKITQLPWGVPLLPSQPEWSNRSVSAGATRLTCVLGGLRRGSHRSEIQRIPSEILILLLNTGTRLLPGIKSFPGVTKRQIH